MVRTEKEQVKIVAINDNNTAEIYKFSEKKNLKATVSKKALPDMAVGSIGIAEIQKKFKGLDKPEELIIHSFEPSESETEEPELEIEEIDFLSFNNNVTSDDETEVEETTEEPVSIEEKKTEPVKEVSKEKEVVACDEQTILKKLTKEQREEFDQVMRIAKSFGAKCDYSLVEILAASKVISTTDCHEAVLFNVAEESYRKLKEKGVI